MGKTDTVTKEYLENPVIFADSFNQFLYHGDQRINPARLTELNTAEIAIPYGADGVDVPEQKYWDVLKLLCARTDGRTAYCVMGIESQAEIHYALPVRNGLYDFLQLSRQVSEAARSHRKAIKEAMAESMKETGLEAVPEAGQSVKALSGKNREAQRMNKCPSEGKMPPRVKLTHGEFLSGFRKTDRLIPVVSLVVYFGSEPWDAPLSLREMYSDVDHAILAHTPDYHINLIAPCEMSDDEINEFRSDLREVVLYIKYSKDKEMLNKIVKGDRKFQSMERQTAEVINVVTGSRLKYPEGKGEVDMCLAIQQMREESEIKGAVETYKDLGISLVDTIKRIAKRFQLSESESGDAVRKYW